MCNACAAYEARAGVPKPGHLLRGAVTYCANCSVTIPRNPDDGDRYMGVPSKFLEGSPQVCRKCGQYERDNKGLRPLQIINRWFAKHNLPLIAASPVHGVPLPPFPLLCQRRHRHLQPSPNPNTAAAAAQRSRVTVAPPRLLTRAYVLCVTRTSGSTVHSGRPTCSLELPPRATAATRSSSGTTAAPRTPTTGKAVHRATCRENRRFALAAPSTSANTRWCVRYG